MNKFCAAAIQMPTVEDKMENIKAVRHYLEQIKHRTLTLSCYPRCSAVLIRRKNSQNTQKKRAVLCGKLFLHMRKNTTFIW